MADFVELAAEGVNHVVDRYWETGWDKAAAHRRKSRGQQGDDSYPQQSQQQQQSPPDQQQQQQQQSSQSQYRQQSPDYSTRAPPPPQQSQTARSARPPPASSNNPNNRNNYAAADSIARTSYSPPRASRRRDDSLERQSETSERVLQAYESERDDPRRRADTVLSKRDLRAMSHANGYAPYDDVGGRGGGSSHHSRPRSQPPADGRYYDDDGYGSDYDEHSGRRYSRGHGRGYDDYDERNYDREIIQTERYHGPARNFPGRQDSGGSRGLDDQWGGPGGGTAGGVVTQYRDRRVERDYDTKRSRSRGRRDRDDSRSRSRSRSGGVLGRLDDHFDKSPSGLGAGLVGAVVGGLAGREIGGRGGHGSQHRNRDILIGAVVGGLGANLAENKWRDWKDGEKRRLERDEDKFEQRWDGRSRSAMR